MARTYKSEVAILKAARRLLSKPERWTQGALRTVTDNGFAFCSLGAIEHVAADHVGERGAEMLLQSVMPQRTITRWDGSKYRTSRSIISFNDSHRTKHEQVLAKFDKAIAKAEKQAEKAKAAKAKARAKAGR